MSHVLAAVCNIKPLFIESTGLQPLAFTNRDLVDKGHHVIWDAQAIFIPQTFVLLRASIVVPLLPLQR